MQEVTISALLAALPNLRSRWEKQLRAEPVLSPMANPDSLVYLMEWTLSELFHRLRNEYVGHNHTLDSATATEKYGDLCACGANPFLRYFESARKAVLRWTSAQGAPLAGLPEGERDACTREIMAALDYVAAAEIGGFCSLCQQRQTFITVPPRRASADRSNQLKNTIPALFLRRGD